MEAPLPPSLPPVLSLIASPIIFALASPVVQQVLRNHHAIGQLHGHILLLRRVLLAVMARHRSIQQYGIVRQEQDPPVGFAGKSEMPHRVLTASTTLSSEQMALLSHKIMSDQIRSSHAHSWSPADDLISQQPLSRLALLRFPAPFFCEID